MSKMKCKRLAGLVALLFLLLLMPLRAFATEAVPSEESVVEPEPTPEITVVTTEPTALEEAILEQFDGNLTVVDNTESAVEGGKQFVTLQSKNGNYFYLVIDYTTNTENVYFLNMVDEADLLALIEEDDIQPVPDPECICDTKCEVGAINTECEVCKVSMSSCEGQEVAAETPEQVQSEVVLDTSMVVGVVVILLIAAAAVGIVVYFTVFKKKKEPSNKPSLEDYDLEEGEDYSFGEDDEDSMESDDDAK